MTVTQSLTTELFIHELKHLCKEYGVELVFGRGSKVVIEGNIKCSGYFDSVNRKLAVAKNRADWLQLLVHESCHVDQWLEQSKVWDREERLGNYQLDNWLLGKHFDTRSIRRAVNNIIRLEHDCERRALTKIAEYDLPINQLSYIQRANAYLYSYHRVFQTRKWVPQVYEKFSIIKHMPEKLLPVERYLTLPKRLENVFIEAGV